MRLCYELGLEEMAAATLKDKVLGYVNTQPVTHQCVYTAFQYNKTH